MSATRRNSIVRNLVLALGGLALLSGAAQADPVHGIAMHGAPKYGPDFTHFDYVNPDAPKGGTVTLAAIGTFDNLNPFILKGRAAAELGRMYDTLAANADDEAFTEYGLLAETIEMPEDRSWVQFNLRAQARWHDGKPVTPEDVIFTLDTLKTKAHPFYRAYYASVLKGEKVGERGVRFSFAEGDNRELPLILGQMTILPKHYWEGRNFEETIQEPPVGSGPYRIAGFEPGRSITYQRDPDYWGRDLPVRKGQDNFDEIRIDYYRDTTVAVEALKAGAYDLRQENVSKNWATAYDVPAVKAGMLKLAEVDHDLGTGMQGFAFNLRRTIFQDPKVRHALAYAFDFEWTNENLFFGAYSRTESYFSNTELASSGLPSAGELAVLEPFRDQLPPEVFTQTYLPPSTADKGGLRTNLRSALTLLREAGWEVRDNKLTNKQTGDIFAFEILLNDPTWERIALPFVSNLERLGITAKVRTVDAAQYQERMDSFDFDMTVEVFGQSLSPGNEQRDFWSSKGADVKGSRNVIGIKNPVVDALVEAVISAPDRQTLIDRTRALDRVLLWGHYVIPHWHITHFRVAYWDKFGRPPTNPPYAFGFDSWWVDPVKAEALETWRKNR